MIGLVLVTHGALADEFKLALEHVVGPQDYCETIAIGPEDNAETRREDILAAIDRAETGDGVIILTDMFGGTPSNLAISVMQNRNVEVIAGVNLPMLVKLGRIRGEMTMQQAVAMAQEAGKKYITVANAVLGGA
ncbi:PTS sugar transporter subunit IIA [Devosia sp. 63-57]|uniref:PTS sugar transporter subunit IIA n=1 Tax=Devosia sp. 63-57 TaxID=1895751 RepID=UPI00086CB075|nr:PTS sugar transporter subunit IIA [Devosia sp. 63-57]ODT48221.1 MAG: PTS fructose transporter subunit IIA [Pelagibacterium sp. SCN 63-126]ODU84265.1 MAG: PTS fructose transporter subunit IIA [Pelagibacterium sp. SCN 63-17]OJX42068.1 MAG: PTS fructose transporter subunit IIA [Devosia sp. 63-57]